MVGGRDRDDFVVFKQAVAVAQSRIRHPSGLQHDPGRHRCGVFFSNGPVSVHHAGADFPLVAGVQTVDVVARADNSLLYLEPGQIRVVCSHKPDDSGHDSRSRAGTGRQPAFLSAGAVKIRETVLRKVRRR